MRFAGRPNLRSAFVQLVLRRLAVGVSDPPAALAFNQMEQCHEHEAAHACEAARAAEL